MGRSSNFLTEKQRQEHNKTYNYIYYYTHREQILENIRLKKERDLKIQIGELMQDISSKLYNKKMIQFFREYVRTNPEYLMYKMQYKSTLKIQDYYKIEDTIKIERKKILMYFD